MEETKKSVFDVLSDIDCNEHIEKKGPQKLSYLSWSWAWSILKKNFPDATYQIYENEKGMFYHTDGRTGWVKTGVTVNGVEYIDYLPIMDFANRSIPLDKITSYDVNKAIQRSITKAIARHGLGLYVYAGEDYPEENNKSENDNQLSEAIEKIKSASNKQQLKDIYNSYPSLQSNIQFTSNLTVRKNQLSK
ncbi:MAG: DUF1071 domain-containing protein [Lachnospira sp.]